MSSSEISWWLPYLFYAIITAIFTGILAPTFWKLIGSYLEKRKKNSSRKKKVSNEIKNYTGIIAKIQECVGDLI